MAGVRIQAEKAQAELDPCFAAGTLVHTSNGLVPIEQIKVGDLVLSQPEDGGELSYKPVTRTFEHDFKEVMLLDVGLLQGPRSLHATNQYYCRDTKEEVGRGKGVPSSREYIIATPNRPFFAKRHGGGATPPPTRILRRSGRSSSSSTTAAKSKRSRIRQLQ